MQNSALTTAVVYTDVTAGWLLTYLSDLHEGHDALHVFLQCVLLRQPGRDHLVVRETAAVRLCAAMT